MAFEELLMFENPGFVAFVIGVLIFAVAQSVIGKFFNDKGAGILMSIVLGATGGFYIYRERYLESLAGSSVAFLIILAVVAILIKLFWGFGKGTTYTFRG